MYNTIYYMNIVEKSSRIENPVCFLAPLMKQWKKTSVGGGSSDMNPGEDRLKNLGIPWGLMQIPPVFSSPVDIEETIEYDEPVNDIVFEQLWQAIKTK